LVPTLRQGLYANRFTSPDGHETVWTLFNATDEAIDGPVIRVADRSGVTFHDPIIGKAIAPRRDGETLIIATTIPPRRAGCVVGLAVDDPARAAADDPERAAADDPERAAADPAAGQGNGPG
jgi:hypothetical protein